MVSICQSIHCFPEAIDIAVKHSTNSQFFLVGWKGISYDLANADDYDDLLSGDLGKVAGVVKSTCQHYMAALHARIQHSSAGVR